MQRLRLTYRDKYGKARVNLSNVRSTNGNLSETEIIELIVDRLAYYEDLEDKLNGVSLETLVIINLFID